MIKRKLESLEGNYAKVKTFSQLCGSKYFFWTVICSRCSVEGLG